jgi:CMP-N,N'-diacetyllegionaminic acid synthase
MHKRQRLLAVVPARGGSKGLPGKNVRPLVGLPLIAHTLLFAKLCPDIERLIVTTDSEDIATVARGYDSDVPFVRPKELAQDDTPLWPVLQHALNAVEKEEGRSYDLLLLLDPTSPARLPADVSSALVMLNQEPAAAGILGVSQPSFNPIWHCVTAENGWMADLFDTAAKYTRRQDVPVVYRINGSIYLWRTEFVRSAGPDWRREGRHLIFEIPEIRAMSIDDLSEFNLAELLVRQGLVEFPWLKRS